MALDSEGIDAVHHYQKFYCMVLSVIKRQRVLLSVGLTTFNIFQQINESRVRHCLCYAMVFALAALTPGILGPARSYV